MRVSVSSTTGFVNWKTEDATDLDYTPLPLIVRNNNEESFQFTQEVRVASAPNASIRLSDAAALKWQAGVFLFTQNYEQNAVNTLAPFTFSPFINFPLALTLPDAELDDFGIGVYGQGTVTLDEPSRSDRRRARRPRAEGRVAQHVLHAADRAADATSIADESFSNVSPQFSAAVPHSAGEDGLRLASRAATRRAASIPCRRSAARPTAKSTPGISKAA